MTNLTILWFVGYCEPSEHSQRLPQSWTSMVTVQFPLTLFTGPNPTQQLMDSTRVDTPQTSIVRSDPIILALQTFAYLLIKFASVTGGINTKHFYSSNKVYI